MPNLITLETTHGTLTVWSKDVTKSRQQLANTYFKRKKILPLQEIQIYREEFISCTPLACIVDNGLQLREPILFENKNYEFSFKFKEIVNAAEICHYLSSIEDSFRFVDSTLRGTINFRNDIGWFRFQVRYQQQFNKKWKKFSIAIQVLPIKMDLVNDFEKINRMIDREYPLWRFSFLQKTDQNLNRTKQSQERFPLLWLAQFNSLCDELLRHVKYICNAPHNRLQTRTRTIEIDKLKGRLSHKLENQIAELKYSKVENKRLNVKSQFLSVDIMENRFVHMVLFSSRNSLARFTSNARKEKNNQSDERLTDTFFRDIHSQQEKIERQLTHSLFRELGSQDTELFESLVLQKRAGYSGVYRIWQQLKLYLDVLGSDASISLKTISELYEVWCVLEIRNILLASGFTETKSLNARLREKSFGKELADGLGASFTFQRSDGIKLRLAHEPFFSKPKYDRLNKIYSWSVNQNPDIVLEATFPNNEMLIWIFDAKYRIDTDANENSKDMAPEDSLNQMHRYRDALIYLAKGNKQNIQKSRPVIGAYVLYPGWYSDDEQENPRSNPYADSIKEIGIGAFSALPGQQNLWLSNFLKSQLGECITTNSDELVFAPDAFLAEESVRIAPSGLYLKRSGEFIFLVQLATSISSIYRDSVLNGTVTTVYISEAELSKRNINAKTIHDISHCGIISPLQEDNGKHVIHYTYSITTAFDSSNHVLTDLDIKKFGLDSKEHYFKLELSNSISCPQPKNIELVDNESFFIVDFNLFQTENKLLTRY